MSVYLYSQTLYIVTDTIIPNVTSIRVVFPVFSRKRLTRRRAIKYLQGRIGNWANKLLQAMLNDLPKQTCSSASQSVAI